MSEGERSVRERTIRWEDPVEAARIGRTMDGARYLRAIAEGAAPAPPIAALLDMRLTEVGEGRAVFTLTPQEFHYNPIGSVHGGVAATLLDSAMGCAINTLLPQGTAYTTLEIKVNYVRALTRETGAVRCEGRVIHLGGKIATAEGTITDAAGKLYAHATTTCIILRG